MLHHLPGRDVPVGNLYPIHMQADDTPLEYVSVLTVFRLTPYVIPLCRRFFKLGIV